MKQGCKHKNAGKMIFHAKKWVMEKCIRLGFGQNCDIFYTGYEEIMSYEEFADLKEVEKVKQEQVSGMVAVSEKNRGAR